MLERTKKPHIEFVNLTFKVPLDKVQEVKKAVENLGIPPARPWLKDLGVDENADLRPICLSGARCKENLTQAKLSEMTGIPRRHISEMENGKRPIGKKSAQKLAAALNISPDLLLKP